MDEQEEKNIAVAIGKLETKMEFMSDNIRDLSKKLDDMVENYQEIGGIMKGYADLQGLINKNADSIEKLEEVMLSAEERDAIKFVSFAAKHPKITFFVAFVLVLSPVFALLLPILIEKYVG